MKTRVSGSMCPDRHSRVAHGWRCNLYCGGIIDVAGFLKLLLCLPRGVVGVFRRSTVFFFLPSPPAPPHREWHRLAIVEKRYL